MANGEFQKGALRPDLTCQNLSVFRDRYQQYLIKGIKYILFKKLYKHVYILLFQKLKLKISLELKKNIFWVNYEFHISDKN